MRLNITHDLTHAFLTVTLTGQFNLDEAVENARRFLETSARLKVPKILVDTREVEGSLSVLERWTYANFIADQIATRTGLGLPPVRLAYLGRPPILDPGKFGEVVAANRGVLVKSTTGPDEAMAWLMIGE